MPRLNAHLPLLEALVSDSAAPMVTVLIVDDEPSILDLLREVLEDAGYCVLTAADGRAALAVAQHNPVHLILTDLMMPLMDGQALCLQLRADTRTAQILILLMTAARQPQLHAPFSAVISKPFDVTSLLRLVQRYIASG